MKNFFYMSWGRYTIFVWLQCPSNKRNHQEYSGICINLAVIIQPGGSSSSFCRISFVDEFLSD